jgi:histidyl-tRNA synthetase
LGKKSNFAKKKQMAQQVSIPKGTRDFGPAVMQKREFIFDIIKSVFRLHGYQPLETPSMENLTTLLGKYGEEGDKLLFRILNSGDFLSSTPQNIFDETPDHKKLTPHISEKGLRYDLTVPFARFVVMNRNELQFPFKRYQIQPVWRADRPQKGRYREFYQCDVDVIGSKSMLNEFELIQILDAVFQKLKLQVTLHINNRKILDGILQSFQVENKLNDVAIAIDKLDKAGPDAVVTEMVGKGIDASIANKLLEIISLKDTPQQALERIKPLVGHTVSGAAGIEELTQLATYISNASFGLNILFDLSLARGLDYYTGAIFEVKANDVQMGSICGGGRYDDLTAFFGLPDMSGVGVSFGADRIYDVMNELQLFPESVASSTKVMFVNFGQKELNYVMPLSLKLRHNNVSTEIYPDDEKMKKQMNYANKKNIPFVVIAGEEEMSKGIFVVKNMISGEQMQLSENEIITLFTT